MSERTVNLRILAVLALAAALALSLSPVRIGPANAAARTSHTSISAPLTAVVNEVATRARQLGDSRLLVALAAHWAAVNGQSTGLTVEGGNNGAWGPYAP